VADDDGQSAGGGVDSSRWRPRRSLV